MEYVNWYNENMKTLLEEASAEIEVKKSKFISIAYPVRTLEEARDMVSFTRKLHPNANHVVHAAVVGDNGTMYSSSDDKEPKNTAGRPALEVLKGSGITNIVVCIIRYFGGTLLGTGGLVKAYSDSTKEVLKVVKTEELIERVEFSLLLDYEFYTLVKRLMTIVEAVDLVEDFLVGISVKGRIPIANVEELKQGILEIGQGRIQLTL